MKLLKALFSFALRQFAAQGALQFQLFGRPAIIADAFPTFANFERAGTLIQRLFGKRFKLR
jgi:hypothetical protein